MSSFMANSAIEYLASPFAGKKARNAPLEEEVLSLFDRMRMPLLRYALSFGVSMHDGEDIVQETFLALFRHLQLGRSRENLQGWLFQVTHNLALKRRMRNATEPVDLVTIEWRDPEPNPEDLLLLGERQARLQSALRALPEVDQSCLRLRAEGLRYREIAKVLGISLGSVSTSLARSLARLERAERR